MSVRVLFSVSVWSRGIWYFVSTSIKLLLYRLSHRNTLTRLLRKTLNRDRQLELHSHKLASDFISEGTGPQCLQQPMGSLFFVDAEKVRERGRESRAERRDVYLFIFLSVPL